MSNFLNLREKIEPQVKVVYKTVVKQQPWYLEVAKVLAVIAIVTTVVWGVSKAQEGQQLVVSSEVKTFSIGGEVSVNASTTLSIGNAKGFERADITSFTFDTAQLGKVESNEDVPMQLSDIQTGDRVVVQGTYSNNVFSAVNVVSFAPIIGTTTIDTSTDQLTATSTEDIASTSSDTATNTDAVGASADETSTSTTTTSPSFIENVIDTIKDIVNNIVGGTTTPDSATTDSVATSTTPDSNTDTTGTTTENNN